MTRPRPGLRHDGGQTVPILAVVVAVVIALTIAVVTVLASPPPRDLTGGATAAAVAGAESSIQVRSPLSSASGHTACPAAEDAARDLGLRPVACQVAGSVLTLSVRDPAAGTHTPDVPPVTVTARIVELADGCRDVVAGTVHGPAHCP